MANSKRYLTKNQDFHFLIYKSSAMTSAVDIIETLWLQIGPSFNLLLLGQKDRSAPATSTSSLTSHHDAVLKALEQRKPAAVRRALEQDIYDGMEFLMLQTNT